MVGGLRDGRGTAAIGQRDYFAVEHHAIAAEADDITRFDRLGGLHARVIEVHEPAMNGLRREAARAVEADVEEPN